jgi:hypothetical protein
VARGLLTVAQILNALAKGPARIADYTSGLTRARLHTAPRPGEWSANKVLAHLRSCADVWGDCIATILQQENPTIRAVNPRGWIQKTDYLEQEFRSSLQAYTAQRTALLSVLELLSPDAWSRSARVTGAGKALERTVYSYADWMAEHERPHLKQIRRIADVLRPEEYARKKT